MGGPISRSLQSPTLSPAPTGTDMPFSALNARHLRTKMQPARAAINWVRFLMRRPRRLRPWKLKRAIDVRKAAASPTKAFRCAIYTRKSSEEGLEQDFNSLHAQRESCDAYIKSQRHEGWTALPSLYDDGGYSGGSTERPALKRLLADIQSHLIDVVVVYKVDRLTRSLADFAKIVEIFDAAGVSFVSVTQQFNTTTSMGRLTLNVLLSFAQFEREVTGERIRDKIAASKAQISNLLRETRCRPAEIGRGLKIASELADSLTSDSPMAQGVADLLARVTASHRSLKISIKRDRLLATLRDKFVEQSQDDGQDNVISLEVTVPAVSGGGSSKLIFEDKNAKTPDAVVVKAIARASIWFEQLTAGNSQSMAQIAVRETITDNYVSNLIHLAWLSPDLVGRVLQGDSEATALAKTALLTRKSETLWRGR